MQVLVIGAGVVGLAVARAAALAGHRVLVAEATRGIGNGISSRNSEVVHGGMYYRRYQGHSHPSLAPFARCRYSTRHRCRARLRDRAAVERNSRNNRHSCSGGIAPHRYALITMLASTDASTHLPIRRYASDAHVLRSRRGSHLYRLRVFAFPVQLHVLDESH
jgi:2-polyprenyl-6-methoxyphenol hydroxylase-like FAD-dependent oxidoreductase